MTITENSSRAWQPTTGAEFPAVGPSDREVVDVLQRIASARAHLAQAERSAEGARRDMQRPQLVERNRAVEAVHAELLWAQAALLTTRRRARAEKELRLAEVRERGVLARHGFASFADYLAERNATPTTDVHLALARREYESALEAWAELQEAMAPTLVIDLTGDEPRVL